MNKIHENEYRNLIKNIKYYRKEAHLNQEGLALRAHISRGYLSQIEAPNIDSWPSLDMVFNIAKALNIPVSWLFEHWEEK